VVPATYVGVAAVIEDTLLAKVDVPAQRYLQRFNHNISLAVRPHRSNKTRGARVLPVTERGRQLWEASQSDEHNTEPSLQRTKRRRTETRIESDFAILDSTPSSSCPTSLQARIDSIVVDDDCLLQERGTAVSGLDDPIDFGAPEDDDHYFNFDQEFDMQEPVPQSNISQPDTAYTNSNVETSAVLVAYEEGELDQFPTLADTSAGNPWAIPPRSANRQLKPKSDSSRVRARRRNAADYPAWEWSCRFDTEPKFQEQNRRQTTDEARAELRRQLDEGPTGPNDNRRVRARRWYVPGRPPD